MSIEQQNKLMWDAMSKLAKMKGLTDSASRLIMETSRKVMELKKSGQIGGSESMWKEVSLPITIDSYCKVSGNDTHIFKILKKDELEVAGKKMTMYDVRSYWNLKTNTADDSIDFHNVTPNLITPILRTKL